MSENLSLQALCWLEQVAGCADCTALPVTPSNLLRERSAKHSNHGQFLVALAGKRKNYEGSFHPVHRVAHDEVKIKISHKIACKHLSYFL